MVNYTLQERNKIVHNRIERTTALAKLTKSCAVQNYYHFVMFYVGSPTRINSYL